MCILTTIFAGSKDQRFEFLRENFIHIFYKYHQDRFSIKQVKLRPLTTFVDSEASQPIDINTTAQFVKLHHCDLQAFVVQAIGEVIKYGNVQLIGGAFPHSAILVRNLFADEDSLIVNISEDIVIEIIDFLCSDSHYSLLCDICFPCLCEVIEAANKHLIPVSVNIIKPPNCLITNRNRVISCSNWSALVQYASADVILKLCGIPWLDEIPCFS